MDINQLERRLENSFRGENMFDTQIFDKHSGDWERKFIALEQQINNIEYKFCNTQKSEDFDTLGYRTHQIDRADLKILETKIDEKLDNLVTNLSDLTKKFSSRSKKYETKFQTLENHFANALLEKARKNRDASVRKWLQCLNIYLPH